VQISKHVSSLTRPKNIVIEKMTDNKGGGCCPPGSLPKRAPGAHQAKGKYTKAGDLDVYVSGEGKNGGGILLCCEIFGIKSGDLAEFADYFADNGYLVVLPDWHRGGYFQGFPADFMGEFAKFVAKNPWSGIEADMAKHVLPIFHKAGVKRIAAIGLCYGTWVTLHAAGAGKVHCVMNFHPSHIGVAGLSKEDPAKLVAAVKVPVLQFPSGQDPAETKPGGSDEKTLKANVGEHNVCFKEFKDMPHGWVSRADHKDPKQVEAQTEAWGLGLSFVDKHLAAK